MIFPAWLWIGLLAAATPCGPGDDVCSCIGFRPPREAFERADAVFRGVVLDVSTRPNERSGPGWLPPRRVLIRVTERWKGAETDRVVVRTGMGDADCGYHFRRGREYLIYAYATEDSVLVTGICSRTRQIEHAEEDLRELRAFAQAAEPE